MVPCIYSHPAEEKLSKPSIEKVQGQMFNPVPWQERACGKHDTQMSIKEEEFQNLEKLAETLKPTFQRGHGKK